MIVFEKFLGNRAEIPEDRRYYIKQGIWAKQDDQYITCGLGEPALILAGGIKDLDWLVPEGQSVKKNEAVIFAITGKILYMDSPINGPIFFNKPVKQFPERLLRDPYESGWLFRLALTEKGKEDFQGLAEPWAYAKSLENSEGCKNPNGLKGGVSGMCKAVYSGIGAQRMQV